MTSKAIPILFYALALVIHGVPTLSVVVPQKMVKLYGIAADDQLLMALLQHRALMFGLVTMACIYAAHTSFARWPVLIGTTISMAGFLLIAVSRGEAAGSLRPIVIVDSLGLIIAAVLAVLLLKVKS